MVWEQETRQEAIFTQAGLTLTLNSENSRGARLPYKERRKEWKWKIEEVDPLLQLYLIEEEKKGRERETNVLMSFPPILLFLYKRVNHVKFIFFAASVFYKGSFNLFLLCPVGDPRSFFFFPFSFLFVFDPF